MLVLKRMDWCLSYKNLIKTLYIEENLITTVQYINSTYRKLAAHPPGLYSSTGFPSEGSTR